MDNKDKNKKNPANDPNQGQGVNYEQTARLRIIKSEEIEADLKGKTVKNKLNKIKPMKTSSIYRKKYLVLALVVVLIFVLAYQFVKVKNLDFTTLGANIEKKVSMENFVKGNDLSLRKLYGINKIEVEKYISYVPKSNMMANEILIVKAKPEYADAILARIQKRVDAQSKSFKNYAPDQYKIMSSSVLKKKGDYIYFISYENVDLINKIIKANYE
ncbi:DUF4358 domain-containing protein [Peptostreptococcus stomatis]|uniref:DUF4358 domain-containing protein n=1 Tax=Peptostreptococcus stomatis TaxID=341694 RepID=UPI0026EC4B75|nr:DUF4358 domain-containing protein [Peptostreptococcus stomatis]